MSSTPHPTPRRAVRIRPWLLVAMLCGMAHAGDATFSVSAGVDFSSGKYGGSTATETWYAPLILKYERGPSTFKLSVPYLRITAPSDGEVVDIGPDGLPIYSGTGRRVTRDGLGDVVATYTHAVVEQPWHNWLVDLSAKVKLPTADEDRGLGTGEVDYALLADLYYLAGRFSPFFTLDYRMPGDPPGASLRNVWGLTLGLGYRFSDQDSAGLMAYVRQSLGPDSAEPRELTAYWMHKFTAGLKLQTYAVAGFSDASPDYELGLMLTTQY